MFALVWKKGRIGVKLPNESDYSTLMAIQGAEPWKAGPMTMSHWVLVPAATTPRELKKWVKRAYVLAFSAPPKAAKKTPSAKKKKPTSK